MSDEISESHDVDVTREASKMGWVPLEKFKGDPARWTDAETFYSRGREILPIVRKQNEKLTHELVSIRAEFQSKLNEAQSALAEFQKYHEEDSRRQYERAVEKLKADKKEALRDSDYDAVVEIDEAMKVLDEQKKAKTTPKQLEKQQSQQVPNDPSQDPEFKQWHNENSDWYGVDKERTAYATSQAAFYRAMEPDLKGREFLDKVTEEVEQRFGLPGKEKKIDRVEGSRGGASRSSGGAKSYADLPADAKATCDKFGSRLVGEGKAYKTQAEWRKQYTKDYFGGE